MKKRFEIPLTPGDGLSEINLFAVDDYLREMSTAEARRKLIATAGATPETRAAYEEQHGLPHGAVELVMLMEDKRIKELEKMLMAKTPELVDKNAKPETIEEFYRLAFSIARGMQQLYPEASAFMVQYAALSQRNRQKFMGDYGFSNEYKLQRVAWCFPSCDGGLNCNVNINTNLNVNILAHVNVAVVNKAAIVLVVWAFIALWPALYGPPYRMS
jgi:hypothetical protein